MNYDAPNDAVSFVALVWTIWLGFLLAWLVKKSKIVSDFTEWFRQKSMPVRILAVCAFTALSIFAGTKGGGNAPQSLPRPPLLLQVAELPPEPSLDLVSVHTNGVAFRTASSNAVEVATWRVIGGTEMGAWIEGSTNAPMFMVGTNPVFRCYASASGSVSFESMRRPPVGAALPDGTGLPVLCPLRAPLGFVPEANLASNVPPSRFWHDSLPGGGMVLTWENALVDRLPGRPVSLQVELRPSGDCAFRYDFPDELDPPPTNFVMGAQFGTNGVNALSVLGTNLLAATVWRVEGEPVTNGVSVADLLCTNDVLRTPAAFELRWKNTTGLDPDADTDNDGLTDWAETFLWGTDPNHADTDGDGIADNVELMMGTDPFDADENGDGIPDGTDEEEWLAHPLWAVNSTNEANVFIVLNEPVPTGASAVLVLDDLAIPLRTPAFWSFAFVPGTAYDYRLVVSHGATVNLSLTNAVPVQTRGLPFRGEPGEEDTPIWDKGDDGVFDGESEGGKGKTAVPKIRFMPYVDNIASHDPGSSFCVHGGDRIGFAASALPANVTPHWETENLVQGENMFILLVPEPGVVYEGTVRLTIEELKVGTLSKNFSAHQCDATEQNPFCSICGCYDPLDAELVGVVRRLTLKYDNQTSFYIAHPHSPGVAYTNPSFEICQPGYTDWTSLSGSTWTARIAGTFAVRGTVEADGREIPVGPINMWVQFPSEAEMIADSAIQDHAYTLWTNTLAHCSATNRQEFGCWILLDTATDTYSFTATTNGPPVIDNEQIPDIELGTPPSDVPFHPSLLHGSAIYTVASLHTHTPTTYSPANDPPRTAGPSGPDKRTSRILRMPGIVYDYTEEPTGAGIPMGHSLDAAAHLYPTEEVERRDRN